MQVSYKIKRLLIVSLVIIVLAVAAHNGQEESESLVVVAGTMTGQTTALEARASVEMDAVILDSNTDSANVSITAQAPVSIKATPLPKPSISAEAYIVANLDTGEIYAQRNPEQVFPIASVSKLVTALVALRSMNPLEKHTVTDIMLLPYGNAGRLSVGERYGALELLYPLLLESSNDAAEVLARSHGYEAFMGLMNTLAATVGMTSTSFADPSGLSPGNVSNARDLFTFARYLFRSERDLLELTRQRGMSLASTTDRGEHSWTSINPFTFDPNFLGGKTGRTNEAREAMLSIFRYNYGGVSYPVAVIVLRSDFGQREIDTTTLFDNFVQKLKVR